MFNLASTWPKTDRIIAFTVCFMWVAFWTIISYVRALRGLFFFSFFSSYSGGWSLVVDAVSYILSILFDDRMENKYITYFSLYTICNLDEARFKCLFFAYFSVCNYKSFTVLSRHIIANIHNNFHLRGECDA